MQWFSFWWKSGVRNGQFSLVFFLPWYPQSQSLRQTLHPVLRGRLQLLFIWNIVIIESEFCGQLSAEEAESFDKKNEIIACFGGGTSILFKAKVFAADIASPIMLTSDGIHDYLSADDLEDIIDEYGVSLQACEKMIEAARRNGSTDDASVIIGGI